MKSNRKSNGKGALGLVAAAVLTAAVAGGVWAANDSTGPGWGHGGMMGGRHGTMRRGVMMGGGMAMMGRRGGHMGGMGAMAGGFTIEDTEARLAETRTELGITTEQDAAWANYVGARLAQVGMMTAHRGMMQSGDARDLSDQDRASLMESGRNQMQALTQATDELYSVLTPEQVQAADRILRGPMGR